MEMAIAFMGTNTSSAVGPQGPLGLSVVSLKVTPPFAMSFVPITYLTAFPGPNRLVFTPLAFSNEPPRLEADHVAVEAAPEIDAPRVVRSTPEFEQIALEIPASAIAKGKIVTVISEVAAAHGPTGSFVVSLNVKTAPFESSAAVGI